MAEFPVFTRSGQESVKLMLSAEMSLSQEEFDRVAAYHSFVFHNVLRIDKFPLKFSDDQSTFNILVVPVMQGRLKIGL